MMKDTNMFITDPEMIDNLISRFLGGNATDEEILKLELWISESEENRKYYLQFKNIWDASAQLPVSTNIALDKVLKQINSRSHSFTFWQLFQRVAAILFFPLLFSALWMGLGKNPKTDSSVITYNKVVTAFGTFSSFKLPDGTKVWLNSGSSLQYPDKFSSSNRNVNLVGEAYFEVQSDEAVPFLVNTPYFTVKATGTKFNIWAEKNSRNPSVTLIEGKVAVWKPGSSGNDLIANLHPDQHMTYDTLNGHIKVITEDSYKHFAWKDGKLVFRNDNISEVARRISLQYNVDIEIKGDEIKQYRYRATFENEPLGELLRLLKISSPVDYTEVRPKALPDGTFSRRKIIIFSTNK